MREIRSSFLARFEEVYGALNKTDSILAAATGHHRLLWIHPFLDGNGRVARLMSHAMLLESLDTGALHGPWQGAWPATSRQMRDELASRGEATPRFPGPAVPGDFKRRDHLDSLAEAEVLHGNPGDGDRVVFT